MVDLKAPDKSTKKALIGTQIPSRGASTLKLPPINGAKANEKTAEASVSSHTVKNGDKNTEFDPEKIADEEKLAMLQETFEEAKIRNGLNINEFRAAMRRTVGHKMTDDEIELLFMKVDASCDGLVDWEEYVTYNLLEYQGKTLMKEMMRVRPFRSEPAIIPSKHREAIVSIEFYPNVRKRDGRCYISRTNGRYVTLSKEGMLSFWNMKMKHLISYNAASDIGDRATPPWLSGLVCMYNVGMLALSSTDRDLTIFDTQNGRFQKRYHLTGLEDCITCMRYWVDPSDFNHARLFWGDTSGSVCMLIFTQCQRGGLFESFGRKRSSYKKISIPEIIRGFFKGVKGYRFNKIHGDWVLGIHYVPGLKCFISCSQTSENSLCIYKLQKKKSNVIFKISKGILCFDYCPLSNTIVTGGMDALVRAWNPYISTRPMYILKGHTRPISHVILNTSKSQVISIDKGRTINIFDMKEQTLLQHITGRVVKIGNVYLSSIFFNTATQNLIMATNKLAILRRVDEEEKVDVRSHMKPVVVALFNKTFKFVVSACQDSVISVWDLYTGEKVIQAVNAHVREDKGVEVPVEITAMTFDQAQRCLITGARDGSIKVWNFNNGNCMHTYNTPGGMEITGVISAKHRIYTTGWSRKIHVYIEGGKEENRKDWRSKHKEDILCMSYMSPNILATGSYDGDVVIWSRDTGHVYCTLNASKGTKPINDGVVQSLESKSSSSVASSAHSDNAMTFEAVVQDQTKKLRMKNKGILRQKEAINRMRENTFLDSKNRKVKTPDEAIIEHPLLSLFHGRTDMVGANNDEKRKFYEEKREEYDDICKNYESSVESILFLASRDRESADTAILVTSGAEGWIRAWSIHHEGGLLGQFNAGHKVGESIHTMCTDVDNNFLITADSLGYVKVWDISEYCKKGALTKSQRTRRWEYLNKTFTYVRFTYFTEDPPEALVTTAKKPINIESRPPPSSSSPSKTMKWPFLANSFRAHTKMINYIDFVDGDKLIITASTDCSIRVWTLNGLYIGTFGETWEHIPKQLKRRPTPDQVRIPSDLRRTGSSSSLKVLNQGRSRLWQIAIDGAKKIIQTQHEEEERAKAEELAYKKLLEESREDGASSVPIGTKHESPRGILRPKHKKSLDFDSGSEILGKSYKKTMHHRMPPTMDKFVEINSSIAVYRCLEFSDVNLDEDDDHRKTLDSIKNTYFGGSLMMKMQGEARRQMKGPELADLFDNITHRQSLPKGKNQKGRIKRARQRALKKAAL